EAPVVVGQHLAMLAEEPDALEQQVAEIGGVQRLEARLVVGVEPAATAIGELCGVRCGEVARELAPVLPVVDETGELAGGPALLVEVLGLDQLLEQPDLVVRVEDGEIGPE